jgi:hypothetical protein
MVRSVGTHRSPALLAIVLCASGCESNDYTYESPCDGGCTSCADDDECPADQICVAGFFGTTNCWSASYARVCRSNAECRSYEVCRIRDASCFLCSYPGRTRRTCEDKRCTTDAECGPANECVYSVFDAERGSCSPRSDGGVADAVATDVSVDSDRSEVPTDAGGGAD